MTIKYENLPIRTVLTKYFNILNVTTLTPENRIADTEIELLIEFILLPESKFSYQRFGRVAKEKIMKICQERGWALTKININNKIYSLIKKGILKRDDDTVIYIHPTFLKGALLIKKAKENNGEMNINFKIKYKELENIDRTDGSDNESNTA